MPDFCDCVQSVIQFIVHVVFTNVSNIEYEGPANMTRPAYIKFCAKSRSFYKYKSKIKSIGRTRWATFCHMKGLGGQVAVKVT